MAVVALATLTDLHLSGNLTAAAFRLRRSVDPSVGWRDAVDGLRNVVLFAGLGAVWIATSVSGKLRSEIRKATVVGFFLSLTVESVQVFSPTRTASIIDLSTNTFGAFLGAIVLAWLITDVGRWKGKRSYLGIPAILAASAYLLAVLCEVLTPLFRNNQFGYMPGGPLAWEHYALLRSLPLSIYWISITDFLLVAPAGFLIVVMLSERGAAERWRAAALIGAALMVACEALHGFIRLPIRWEAAAVNAIAWAFGAWAADRWLPVLSRTLRGAVRARAALITYAVLLVLWGWRPFYPELNLSVIASQLTAGHLIPLEALSSRLDVFSALHVGQQFFLYFPLGCLLAVWPLRLRGRWSHLWPGVFLVVGIELGHIVVAGRFMDVTNALISFAGLGLGWLLVRRVGFRPYGAAM